MSALCSSSSLSVSNRLLGWSLSLVSLKAINFALQLKLCLRVGCIVRECVAFVITLCSIITVCIYCTIMLPHHNNHKGIYTSLTLVSCKMAVRKYQPLLLNWNFTVSEKEMDRIVCQNLSQSFFILFHPLALPLLSLKAHEEKLIPLTAHPPSWVFIFACFIRRYFTQWSTH